MTQMKKMMLIPALVVLSAVAFANKPVNPVKVVSTTHDVVYFKVSCEMIGATMDVYDQTGKMIYSEKVTDKKVLVDFYAEPSGTYTIHVQKGASDKQITYNKESVSHAERASANYIVVTQM
jgi:hypothetical protein